MTTAISTVIGVVTTLGLTTFAYVWLFLRHPEKVEKWIALILRAGLALGGLFQSAHKQYVKYDLQGRVNEFTRGVRGKAPYLASDRVRVEWTDGSVDREAFLREERVILRLRRDDPEELNFMHGSYLFVSASLLAKAKRYISDNQGQSVDL